MKHVEAQSVNDMQSGLTITKHYDPCRKQNSRIEVFQPIEHHAHNTGRSQLGDYYEYDCIAHRYALCQIVQHPGQAVFELMLTLTCAPI